ncbi:S8 family serine peptidase [Halanaerobium saccharolyticum]|uniref:S8 family serine peptidase n=1 Tax=Halanaerobium saccharolyticum TaxID=43595 RepID=UPI003FCC52CA
MKKKFLILIAMLIVGGLVLSACSSDGGIISYTSLSGKVVYNGSDKGVFGAEVFLGNEQDPRVLTDQNGEFSISGLSKSYYTLRVEKEGFKIYEKAINLNEDNNLTVNLIPLNNNTIISGKIGINNSTGYETVEVASSNKSNYETLPMEDLDQNRSEYIENEIIVKYSDSDQVRSLSNFNQAEGLSVSKALNIDKGTLVKYKIKSGKNVKDTIEYFESQPGVEYAEPNYIVYAQAKPDDTLYSPNNQWGLISANMEAAWDQRQNSNSYSIAVLDTGIIPDHRDLQSNLLQGADFVDGNNDGVPSEYNPTDLDPTDPTKKSENGSHGTHVAGVIGADSNNNLGVAGVNWETNILPVRVLNSSQEGSHYDIAEGIYYSLAREAMVINMSFGGKNSSNTLQDAVESADSQGAVLVAASGNSGISTVLYPAAYDETIAVGAINRNSSLTNYSNYGPEIDLVAPGGDDNDGILSTWGYSVDGSTVSDYAYMTGTSMAAAHVSGAAALLLESGVSSTNIRSRLTSTAVDLGLEGKDNLYGYGLLDVYGALLDQKLDRPYIFVSEDNIIENITQSSIVSEFTQMDKDNNYTLSKDQIEGDYFVVVWRDVDSDNSIDAGDYYGVTESRTSFTSKNYYTIDLDMYYVTDSTVSSGILSY